MEILYDLPGVSVQQTDAAVQLSACDGNDPIGGPDPVPDAAGIQKQRFAPPVHQGTVGVAEEKQVQILRLGGEASAQQGLLDTVGMTVTHEDAESVQT